MIDFLTNYADRFYESMDTIGVIARVTFAWAMTIATVIFIGFIIIGMGTVIGGYIKEEIEAIRIDKE